MEAKQNFEALNSQLIEDLPKLIDNCSLIFKQCFKIYALYMKKFNDRVFGDLSKINTFFSMDNNHVLLEENNSAQNSIFLIFFI
jgi:hypothetical protein